MTEKSLPHNWRERTNCVHQISSYTSQVALLDESSWELAHVWGSFSHNVLYQSSQTLWSSSKFPSRWHFRWHALTFCIFAKPYFGLESQSVCQPLSWSSHFSFWLWRYGFRVVHTVKLLWDIQGDGLVTTLDLLVFPNFSTTTIFHVHRLKQIFLTCELFLLELLPSGATMINRRWCYNYQEPHIDIVTTV